MPRLRPIPERKEQAPATVLFDSEEAKKADKKQEEETPVVESKPEAEIKVESKVEEKPEDNDATLALKKQIEALRESEKALKRQHEDAVRQREEALRQANENRAQFEKTQREILDSNETSLGASLAAAKAEMKQAATERRAAREAGDAAAEDDADQRYVLAAAKINTLETGLEEIRNLKKLEEERQKAAPTQPQQPQLPPHVVAWLDKHPEFRTNQTLNSQLNYAFHKSKDEGHVPYSVEQIDRIEEILGMREPENEEEEAEVGVEEKPKQRASIMSAPVSRETPTSSGKRASQTKVTLTPEEKEMAAMSGITEAEYARQKLRLANEKTAGNYGESR